MPERILAIKLADLGDVLNITPALRALRQTFPDARLDALVNPHTAMILQGSGLVDEVVLFPKTQFEGWTALKPPAWGPLARYMRMLRARRYDTVVNFHHLTTRMGRAKQRALVSATGAKTVVGLDNGRGRWITHPVEDRGFGAMREVEYWLALARKLDATSTDLSLHLPLNDTEQARADALLADAGLSDTPFVVLHPGSGGYSLARRWDPPKFAALAAALQRRHNLPAVLVGTPDDDVASVLAAGDSPLIDLSGQTTFRELAGVIQRAQVFVGADSGVMHLAAAARTPVVAIFGPTNHRAWAPWTPYSPSRVVRLNLPCSPCAYDGHSVGQREGCVARTCLADLTVDQVLAAVEELL
jgi:heptosyltransferase-2